MESPERRVLGSQGDSRRPKLKARARTFPGSQSSSLPHPPQALSSLRNGCEDNPSNQVPHHEGPLCRNINAASYSGSPSCRAGSGSEWEPQHEAA